MLGASAVSSLIKQAKITEIKSQDLYVCYTYFLVFSLARVSGETPCRIRHQTHHVFVALPLLHEICKRMAKRKIKNVHTTAGIRWWSPTQLLIYRSKACVWQSGRDAQFSLVYGRMWQWLWLFGLILW